MSKITIIGGDLIEEIGGSYKIFAKEGYEISSNKEVIFNATDGILYGTNGEAPAFNNTIVDFYIDVFRSKLQIPDNYGLKDSDFKGTFGFDRYNETTSGKGKQSLSGFEEMGFNGNKYYVPWLCLWPPKKDLGKITDIDKNYIPVTNGKLTFKICEGKVKSGTAKFTISSNHPNIKIDGSEKVQKQGAINSTLDLTISCEGILEKDVDIEIKNETGIVVGKIKVIKNNIIYIANAKFITVMEEEKTTTNASKQQKRDGEKEQFQSLINNALVYLNKNSLNQALIYVNGRVEDIFVIEKGKINRANNPGIYSNNITTPYFEGIETDNNNQNGDAQIEKELDKAIKELYNALTKNYKKNKKNIYFCEDTINQTQLQIRQYEEKYQLYLNTISGSTKVGGHERNNKTFYVFVDKNQETLDVGGFKYYGYTLGAINCAFIFNQHVKERKFGTFAHELAHSMGLDHTFELNKDKYRPNENLKTQIESKNKQLKNNQMQNKSSSIGTIQGDFIDNLNRRLKNHVVGLSEDVDYSTNVAGQKSFKGAKDYYSRIDRILNALKENGIEENKVKDNPEGNSTLNNNVEAQKEINDLEASLVNNENNYINVNISETQENFMDYDYDSSGATNSNFVPKSFWQWQWEELQNSKYLIKKKLS